LKTIGKLCTKSRLTRSQSVDVRATLAGVTDASRVSETVETGLRRSRRRRLCLFLDVLLVAAAAVFAICAAGPGSHVPEIHLDATSDYGRAQVPMAAATAVPAPAPEGRELTFTPIADSDPVTDQGPTPPMSSASQVISVVIPCVYPTLQHCPVVSASRAAAPLPDLPNGPRPAVVVLSTLGVFGALRPRRRSTTNATM
jgi:hypothetical protein